jgi:superfamily II DNA or RNA helicase
VLLVSPTGSGKSTMGAAMCAAMLARGSRVAWFAHRNELREQAVETLGRFGIESGYSGAGKSLPMQVVSTQGATSCEEVPTADFVVLDEAHHYAADEWGRIPEAYPVATLVLLTATPERADGRGLGHLADDLIVVAQPGELVKLGHLVDCGRSHIVRPDNVQDAGTIACPPVEAYQRHGNGGRNVVFASTVEHACIFAADFKKAGIDARIVHGGLSPDVRAAALDDFATGRVRVLVNVFVLTEGWDCPAVDVVTIARKMGSTSMYMQACGRGLRPSPGKTYLTLLDLAGVSHLHGTPVEDRIFSLDGFGMTRASEAGPRFCRACGELLEEVGPCPRAGCGRSRRGAVKDPKYSRDPLAKFARFKTDTEGERVQRLVKFMLDATRAGRKWQSALYRYKGTYSVAPPAKIVKVALEMTREARHGGR